MRPPSRSPTAIISPRDKWRFVNGDAVVLDGDFQLGETGSFMGRAEARHARPKLFPIVSNSEYFNRAGSLIHTDVTGTHDIAPPPDSRIYVVASGPHAFGPFPPGVSHGDGRLEGLEGQFDLPSQAIDQGDLVDRPGGGRQIDSLQPGR